MKKIMNRLFWYLARELEYSVQLTRGKHYEIRGGVPADSTSDNIIIYFA